MSRLNQRALERPSAQAHLSPVVCAWICAWVGAWALLSVVLLSPVSAQPRAPAPLAKSEQITRGELPPLIRLPSLERPTIQERFAPRAQSLNLWLGSALHLRDDYYSSLGLSGALSYMWSDRWGVELGVRHLWTSLSDEALTLRDQYGLTPDARPQSWAYSVGALFGAGYAKLLFGDHISHLDPLLGAHFELVTADERLIPTIRLAFSPTLLLKNGLKVRLDLAMTLQVEQRERGSVFTTGFLPSLIIGWGDTTRGLKRRLGLHKEDPKAEPKADLTANSKATQGP